LNIADAMGDCSPEEKLKQVKLEQAQGHRVAMVGDGLNDGPVLAGADVSFALGQALPLAQSKADFVFMAGDLKPLVATFGLSRKTLQIVRQNLICAIGRLGLFASLVGWFGHGLQFFGRGFECHAIVQNAAI
jgi:Cu2+-exporting ATPase